ncbi:MAG TPA: MaoC/PaaZ C-terminal domain-containing protein [Acidimicrobiia bacterium]|nr:MaoC/PaaZ C-terminal domain-containing protein [Acidimicrobiia bacterium]
MSVDLGVMGREYGPWEKSWTCDDVMLYALAVGCGWDDLRFVTENSEDIDLEVLPTFAVKVGIAGPGFSFADFGDVAMESIVHGEQRIEFAGPIPVEGSVRVAGRITDVRDKGSGALVVTEWEAVDAATGAPRFTNHTSFFLRGLGGFGDAHRDGSRESTPARPRPDRPPDRVVAYETAPTQTLLYRLASDDHNRVHSDPRFARAAGFDRPILVGLGTLGFAGRALLDAMCDGDPARMRAIEGRFAAPAHPGDTLETAMWLDADGAGATFTTTTQRGDVVLDRGRVEVGDR